MNKLLLVLALLLLVSCDGYQMVTYNPGYRPAPVIRYDTYRPQFYYYQPRPYYVLPNYGGYNQVHPHSGGRR